MPSNDPISLNRNRNPCSMSAFAASAVRARWVCVIVAVAAESPFSATSANQPGLMATWPLLQQRATMHLAPNADIPCSTNHPIGPLPRKSRQRNGCSKPFERTICDCITAAARVKHRFTHHRSRWLTGARESGHVPPRMAIRPSAASAEFAGV